MRIHKKKELTVAQALESDKIEPDKLRADYLERIKNDPDFQEYVVKGIFQREFADLIDTRKIPVDTDDAQIVMNLLVANRMAANVISRILRSLQF